MSMRESDALGSSKKGCHLLTEFQSPPKQLEAYFP